MVGGCLSCTGNVEAMTEQLMWADLQADLGVWVEHYNRERPHLG
jgi:hypothetical protein